MRQVDITKLPRRNFLRWFAGAAALSAAPRSARAQASPVAPQRVRVATGLLATWQCIAWLGVEAGVFKKRGIDMSLPAIAVGSRESFHLLRGTPAVYIKTAESGAKRAQRSARLAAHRYSLTAVGAITESHRPLAVVGTAER